MWKAHHHTLIFLSGLIWLIVGVFLLTFGLSLVIGAINNPFEMRFSFVKTLSTLFGDTKTGCLVCLTSALTIGHLKGRFVLSRSAKRQIDRILSFVPPVPLSRLYSPGYYLLLASMMGMGMIMRWLPAAQDVRGLIDMAIGCALISGSFTYFHYLLFRKKRAKII